MQGLSGIEGSEDHAGEFYGVVNGGHNLRRVVDRFAAQANCRSQCCGNEESAVEALFCFGWVGHGPGL